MNHLQDKDLLALLTLPSHEFFDYFRQQCTHDATMQRLYAGAVRWGDLPDNDPPLQLDAWLLTQRLLGQAKSTAKGSSKPWASVPSSPSVPPLRPPSTPPLPHATKTPHPTPVLSSTTLSYAAAAKERDAKERDAKERDAKGQDKIPPALDLPPPASRTSQRMHGNKPAAHGTTKK